MDKNRLITIINNLFIQDGYVLDFSNNTLKEFVYNSINIDIYEDENYIGDGSKGNKLRQIVHQEKKETTLKLLNDLLIYYNDYVIRLNIELKPISIMYLDELTREINKLENLNYVALDPILEKRFIDISTRSANFNEMSIDEKIKEINNLIENLMRVNKKYITLDINRHTLGIFDDSHPKNYRSMTHCFRHGSEENLNERKNITEMEKLFLIDYGITLLNVIKRIIDDNNSNLIL